MAGFADVTDAYGSIGALKGTGLTRARGAGPCNGGRAA
jgi:hypothetical protein